MSKHITLVLLLVALVGLFAFVRVFWGGTQGMMVVWKTSPSFSDTFVYLPEVTALPKADLMKDHPGVWEQLEAMDLISEEHDAKLAQIRQKRLRRLGHLKAEKLGDVKKTTVKKETKVETTAKD